jgi:siroheme synthase-like protein
MSSPPEFGNNLMPVFLKLEEMKLLIVGGGFVGWEKLSAVLTNSPETEIKMVSIAFSDEVKELAGQHDNVKLVEKKFDRSDLEGINLVIVGINDVEEAARIRKAVHEKRLLVNVADKPALCDFYLGSVVKKGDLKIAISTNGKSPTVAKRMKEFLNETIPDTIDDILQNMTKIREKLRGDFDYKVKKLNEITRGWSDKRDED